MVSVAYPLPTGKKIFSFCAFLQVLINIIMFSSVLFSWIIKLSFWLDKTRIVLSSFPIQTLFFKRGSAMCHIQACHGSVQQGKLFSIVTNAFFLQLSIFHYDYQHSLWKEHEVKAVKALKSLSAKCLCHLLPPTFHHLPCSEPDGYYPPPCRKKRQQIVFNCCKCAFLQLSINSSMIVSILFEKSMKWQLWKQLYSHSAV